MKEDGDKALLLNWEGEERLLPVRSSGGWDV